MQKSKIIAVVGPTATGKSDAAVRLAKRFGGEVVSADSRQVYRELNIGTGKVTKKEMGGVRHHLIDVASPLRQFSVARYRTLAQKAIKDILARGKVPIICGGTGFYLETLLDGLVLPEVKPNAKLRKQLRNKGTEKLYRMLTKLDPRRAATIDPHNAVRLIRAIEIATVLGAIPVLGKKDEKYNVLRVGLMLPAKLLRGKIEKRLQVRLKKGMLAEVRRLHQEGLSYRRMEALGLEYRYLALLLKGELTRPEFEEKLSSAIWQYAKRQITWFKRDKTIRWFDNSKKNSLKKIGRLVKSWCAGKDSNLRSP